MLLAPVLGILGFGLFFLSDFNDLRLHNKALGFLFPVGCLLLVAGTVIGCYFGTPVLDAPWLWPICALLLAAMIYALFFAFPVGEAYASPGQKRPVCTTGLYALCRHPGVLFFIPLMICLWLSLGLPLSCALIWSALNLGLAAFEDCIVFPRLLEGYDSYKKTTSFLLPRRKNRKELP